MNCKEGKKNSTSWSRPVARCSELSRKLCFFCNRETRFVEEQKEGECAYSALLQLSVLYPGSEVLWCEIHWNFHGLWVWMRPHTFHIHESIIAIIHFIMSSRSPPQVYYFFFFEAAALRLAHIVTLKVDYQTDFARTWSRFLQHRFGSRRKCDSWQWARFLIESSQPAGDYVQLNLVWFLSSNTQLASETDCCLTVTTSRLIRSIRQFHLPTRTFYCVDDGVK